MGIEGLRRELSKNQIRKGHISELAGKTVAVDTSAWLYRGAFSCALPLALGENPSGYVHYCMHLAKMLVYHKVRDERVLDRQPTLHHHNDFAGRPCAMRFLNSPR